MRKAVAVITLAGIAGTITLTHTTKAAAQNVTTVTPTAKGIIGCALLGAETVALIQAAAGARPRWAYIVFPLVGAAAGGVGGYFLESAASSSTDTTLTAVSVGTLVLGLGLVVPSVIAYVNATSYRPESDQPSEDNAPSNAPIDESTGSPPAEGGAATPASGGSTAPAATPPAGTGSGAAPAPSASVHPRRIGARMTATPLLRPTGLVDFARGSMSLSVPAISVENSVSLHDMRQYGLGAQSEVRVPVLSGSF
jgi:hypothetical protein